MVFFIVTLGVYFCRQVMIPFKLFSIQNFWRTTFRAVLVSSGTGLYYGSEQTTSSVPTSDKKSILPPITLYQYTTCPFCCKTRAFLDYYGITYTTVEVNPLFKKEMKFSKYRKVPFILTGENNDIQVNDSSLLISVLRSALLLHCSVSDALDKYPELRYVNEKNTEYVDRANKYFIMMYGEANDLHQIREERQWREWVDTKLVHTLSPNIYRTLGESLQAFDYISSVGKFNMMERVLAKYIGAVIMYILSKGLKKKWGLKENVRQSLYDCCDKWTCAIGKHRQFMGGETPNLADLAVYGVLSAIEGLDAFNDVKKHTSIRRWYYAVKDRVIEQEGSKLIV